MAFLSNLAQILAQQMPKGLPGADTTFAGGYPDVPIFQNKTVAASGSSYDPSNDSYTPNTGDTVIPAWQQAYEQLRQGFHKPDTPYGAEDVGMQQLFQNPAFVAKWNQQYPGTLQNVSSALGVALNQWQNKGSSGFLTEALPMIAAIGGGALGALGGAGGAAAGEGASSLSAADAAGGLVPEYGTTAAYNAGMAAPVASSAGTDATLQQILDSSQTPTIGQGVNVAQAGGELPQITLPQPTGAPAVDLTQSATGVDAINNAAPGSIAKGLTDAQVAGSPFAAAAGGAAGGAGGATLANLLKDVGTTAVGTAGASQVLNSGGSEPAPAPPPGSGYTAPDPNGYSNGNIDPNTGMPRADTTATVPGSIRGIPLAKILSGDISAGDLASTVTLGDLGKALGTVGATAGSVYADTQRANALKELSNQYMQMGAPSRARYEASFAPGFDANSIPGYTDALDSANNSMLRKLSTGGNPYGNPAALAEILKSVTGSVALPAISAYRNQNAATGGYGAFSTAAPGAATGSIDATGSAYADLGRGAANLLGAPTSLADILKQLRGSPGSSALSLA